MYSFLHRIIETKLFSVPQSVGKKHNFLPWDIKGKKYEWNVWVFIILKLYYCSYGMNNCIRAEKKLQGNFI